MNEKREFTTEEFAEALQAMSTGPASAVAFVNTYRSIILSALDQAAGKGGAPAMLTVEMMEAIDKVNDTERDRLRKAGEQVTQASWEATHRRAWAAALAASPPPAEKAEADEIAWLIELRGNRPTYWSLAVDEPGWEADHDKALRFARREDAQAYIDDIGWTDAFPTEHMWLGPRVRSEKAEAEPVAWRVTWKQGAIQRQNFLDKPDDAVGFAKYLAGQDGVKDMGQPEAVFATPSLNERALIAKIAAWLRSRAEDMNSYDEACALRNAADGIEHGDHDPAIASHMEGGT
jgi:hypothetical protein